MSVNCIRAPGSPVRRFAGDDAGAAKVEYAMIAAGIVLGIVAVIGDIGQSLALF